MAKNTDEKQDIQDAVKAFGSKSLSEAGINLFSTLGYDTSLQDRIFGGSVVVS